MPDPRLTGPRLEIQVTEHDINWAARDDSSRCMVARALAREVDDANRIEVDTQTIRFSTNKGRFAYLTPLAVQRYVAAFDAGEPIEPFKFTLRNPMQLRQRVMSAEQKAEYRLRGMTEANPGGLVRRSKAGLQGRVSPTAADAPDSRKAPPRVFKTRSRTYGHRVLRINQPMQATALDEPVAETPV